MFAFRPLEALPDVVRVEFTRHGDQRGWFAEVYKQSVFASNGILAEFRQDNHSKSAEKGTLRGLHYQVAPFAQGKLIRVNARRGVVLACGGFPHDVARRKAMFPHADDGTAHFSPGPAGNTGDGRAPPGYSTTQRTKAKKFLGNVQFCTDSYSLAKGCDCLLLLTEWEEFRNLDFKKIKRSLRQAVIFDGRNHLDKEKLEKLGFEYFGIGRGKA